jgi:hypothetical protein
MELKTAALWRPSDQGETTRSKPQKSQNLQKFGHSQTSLLPCTSDVFGASHKSSVFLIGIWNSLKLLSV